MNYEYYPSDKPTPKRPYYLEFFNRQTCTLYRAQFIYTDTTVQPQPAEVHPWNLFSWTIQPPNLIHLCTEAMSKFMVDAMNDKYEAMHKEV